MAKRRNFTDQFKAKETLEAWQEDYNIHRPLSALGNLTPMEFAEKMSMDKLAAYGHQTEPKSSPQVGGNLGLRSHVPKNAWVLDPSRLQLHDHCGRPGQCQRENHEENQRKHDRPEFARQLANQSPKPFRTPGTLFKTAVDHRHIKR